MKAQQLRVSSKHGAYQVSTHVFQFPLLWGISFICLKALLGWILTQTLYVMPIASKCLSMRCRRYWSWASPYVTLVWLEKINLGLNLGVSFWQHEFEFDNVDVYMGYSIRAMIPGLIIAAAAAAIPIILSFRALPLKSVIVGTDSAVIASYCQPNTTSDRQDEDLESQQNPDIQLDNLIRSRRDTGMLRWGVLDLGSTQNQRPGVLGLGTEEEVINVSPIAGHEYISVALASDGVNHSYQGQAAVRRG